MEEKNVMQRLKYMEALQMIADLKQQIAHLESNVFFGFLLYDMIFQILSFPIPMKLILDYSRHLNIYYFVKFSFFQFPSIWTGFPVGLTTSRERNHQDFFFSTKNMGMVNAVFSREITVANFPDILRTPELVLVLLRLVFRMRKSWLTLEYIRKSVVIQSAMWMISR